MILIADSKILSIPIKENYDEMIDIRNAPFIETTFFYGPSPEIEHNLDYTKMRKSVYERLKKAQTLLPKGLYFCLYEAYRSLSLQEMLFTHRLAKLKKKYPDWPFEKIFVETTKMVSPVINQDGTRNIPPHSTGGAIDVYLIDNNGHSIDMGIHPKDWMEDIDGMLSETLSSHISDKAIKNRAMMAQALSSVGFINYQTEYWHWSYGDRFWAYHDHSPHALYGSYE